MASLLIQAYRTIAFSAYGSLNFTQAAFIGHSKNFNKEDVEVDMSGKNCVITGANAGIGYATAEALAARGANVVLVCRSKERGEDAVTELQKKTGNPNIKLDVCDLSSLKSVKDLALRYLNSNQNLHILIHNAGVMENERKVTEEGLELNFAVNVAAPYILTEMLLPALAQSTPDSRVITVSSGGMYGSPLVRDLQFTSGKYSGLLQYARNKRLQVVMTEKWANAHGTTGVGFYSMHPGWVDTASVARSMPEFKRRFENKLRTPEQGADTVVWLATQPKHKLRPGAFYFDRGEAPKHLFGCGTGYRVEDADAVLSEVHRLCFPP